MAIHERSWFFIPSSGADWPALESSKDHNARDGLDQCLDGTGGCLFRRAFGYEENIFGLQRDIYRLTGKEILQIHRDLLSLWITGLRAKDLRSLSRCGAVQATG